MAAIATITVPDAAGTPVNHNFVPSRIEGDTASYVEQSATSSTGFWPLTVTQRAPLTGQKDRVFRTKINLAIPRVVQETINGVMKPSVVRTAFAEVHLSFGNESTLQERKNLVGMVYSALAPNQTMINSVITNLENVY